MAGNSNLAAAKTAKEDEFYTQLTDIEKELRHYRKHFMGMTVLCNCDDPFESNFFKYFVLNFNRLGLKKLIATCYYSSSIVGSQLRYYYNEENQLTFSLGGEETDCVSSKRPYKAIVTQVYDKTGDGGVDMVDVAELFASGENQLEELKGNGDFRSDECLVLLDEADIVVTNPPFSLFREYLATLIEHSKKFLIIGNQSAITYKEVFPLLKNNQVWLGYKAGDMAFAVPDYYEPRETRYWEDETGQKWRSMGNICWYTNLDVRKRHEELILVKKYSADTYPTYDNFNGIDVSKISEIPSDYCGIMGVPITILDVFNPNQFEIVGFGKGQLARSVGVQKNHRGRTDLAYTDANGKKYCPFGRILIRNKKPEQSGEVKA